MLTGKPVTYPIPSPAGGVQMETFIPWTLVKRGIRREIITPLDGCAAGVYGGGRSGAHQAQGGAEHAIDPGVGAGALLAAVAR